MLLRHLDMLPDEPVSHNPNVSKRVLVRNGEIPTITHVSRATLPPGEICVAHSHSDMWEMFIAERGCGAMIVDGHRVALDPGTCLIISPGESHELANCSTEDLVVTTTGWISGAVSDNEPGL